MSPALHSFQTNWLGCVEELMSLDLGFGTLDSQFQDIEIFNDKPDPVDLSPAHVEGMMHGTKIILL